MVRLAGALTSQRLTRKWEPGRARGSTRRSGPELGCGLAGSRGGGGDGDGVAERSTSTVPSAR